MLWMGRKTSLDQSKDKGIHRLSTIEAFAVTEIRRSSPVRGWETRAQMERSWQARGQAISWERIEKT
jgi:hypothetical protein